MVFRQVELTNLVRIGFGLSPVGRKWVMNGPVVCIPPVLFKAIDIFLVVFCDLIHVINRRTLMDNGLRG